MKSSPDDTNESCNKQAIVLRYSQDQDSAPRVKAKGRGYIADQILDIGKKHSIPVYQNSPLASMLMAVEIEHEIPPELYKAVAEVLAYIYRIDQGSNEKKR